MVLLVHRWDEIIFLSQYSMCRKLSHATVAKVVQCDMTTVKHWLKRCQQWKYSNDWIRSGPLYDEQIISLAKQQTLVTARDIANKLRKTGTTVNERTTIQRHLNETAAEHNRPLSKSLRLPKCIENIVQNGLKIAKLRIGNRWSFQTRHLFSKRIGMELARKREDRTHVVRTGR